MKPVGDHLAKAAVQLPPAPTPSAPSGKAPARAPVEAVAATAPAPSSVKLLPPPSQDVRFRIDEDSGEPVAVVVDSISGDVIRQIPSEEMLALKRQLGRLEGVMLREKA